MIVREALANKMRKDTTHSTAVVAEMQDLQIACITTVPPQCLLSSYLQEMLEATGPTTSLGLLDEQGTYCECMGLVKRGGSTLRDGTETPDHCDKLRF
jgi:hypothetical protein